MTIVVSATRVRHHQVRNIVVIQVAHHNAARIAASHRKIVERPEPARLLPQFDKNVVQNRAAVDAHQVRYTVAIEVGHCYPDGVVVSLNNLFPVKPSVPVAKTDKKQASVVTVHHNGVELAIALDVRQGHIQRLRAGVPKLPTAESSIASAHGVTQRPIHAHHSQIGNSVAVQVAGSE